MFFFNSNRVCNVNRVCNSKGGSCFFNSERVCNVKGGSCFVNCNRVTHSCAFVVQLFCRATDLLSLLQLSYWAEAKRQSERRHQKLR